MFAVHWVIILKCNIINIIGTLLKELTTILIKLDSSTENFNIVIVTLLLFRNIMIPCKLEKTYSNKNFDDIFI